MVCRQIPAGRGPTRQARGRRRGDESPLRPDPRERGRVRGDHARSLRQNGLSEAQSGRVSHLDGGRRLPDVLRDADGPGAAGNASPRAAAAAARGVQVSQRRGPGREEIAHRRRLRGAGRRRGTQRRIRRPLRSPVANLVPPSGQPAGLHPRSTSAGRSSAVRSTQPDESDALQAHRPSLRRGSEYAPRADPRRPSWSPSNENPRFTS